jgi:hypothetical protein
MRGERDISTRKYPRSPFQLDPKVELMVHRLSEADAMREALCGLQRTRRGNLDPLPGTRAPHDSQTGERA